MTNESQENKAQKNSKKAASSWHQVLIWTELSFTLVIAWTTYLLPEISLAVAERVDPETLLNWKNSSYLRSGAIALIYIVFLLAFNFFYVFLLKPNSSRKRMIMIVIPIVSFVLVFVAGVIGTIVAVG